MSNLVQQVLSLVGICFFFYFAYDGVFQGGGSNSVFIGVAILSGLLVAAKFVERLLND